MRVRVRVRIGFRSWVQGAGADAGKVRETCFHFFDCLKSISNLIRHQTSPQKNKAQFPKISTLVISSFNTCLVGVGNRDEI